MAASLEERRQRVRGGSRRKRDLAAAGLQSQADHEAERSTAELIAHTEREERQRPKVKETAAASAAWTIAKAATEASVPESTFMLWIQPVTCIGEVDGALALEMPALSFDWFRRRYAGLIGEAIRAETDYRGAFLFLALPEPDEGLI
ncbi:MAG TPA: hypothetical protein VMS11_01825 [Solirubrobacterales bacterium]|nr:hypothetical protein [Solirubrobacterales bacterium]